MAAATSGGDPFWPSYLVPAQASLLLVAFAPAEPHLRNMSSLCTLVGKPDEEKGGSGGMRGRPSV